MREARLTRKTNETNITLALNIDGVGNADIDTGVGFLNHMLELFARHARFDLNVKCVGDTDVDAHHTTEDIGIVLGQAFKNCLGDKRGILRYADKTIPMDETLVLCALDISGRSCLVFEAEFTSTKVGCFDTELVREFFEAFVRSSEITLHIKKLYGTNSHHIAEGIFKAFARVLADGVKIDGRFKDEIPSTKGVI